MKKILLSIVSLFILTSNLLSQIEGLPNWKTPLEAIQYQSYLENIIATGAMTDPPSTPVRTMAEWEEVQAIMITWTGYTSILTQIVQHAVEETNVIIITSNPTSVSNTLTNANIPLDNVILLNEDYNSIWIRDYGPWTVYHQDVDTLAISDWIYNRPRPKDDVIPTEIAEYYAIPIYEAISGEHALTHTGGNHLVDGMGTAFSSDLVLDENPTIDQATIEMILGDFLGVDEHILFPTLPYDVIHHLDMHMRLLDEETILFSEYPPGVADGPQIEANIDYLVNNFTTPFGNPYNIVRVPSPPDQFNRYPDENGDYRTYTNSIFINKTILVPTYEQQYDEVALAIYEENLPGYNVVGINCNQIISALGALHCITKLVGTDDPLWIAHARLRDTEETTTAYPVEAIIKHRSGINNAQLNYKTNLTDSYTTIEMSLVNSESDTWAAEIPAQENGTTVYYYIAGEANGGKTQTRPIVAPEGYFDFLVGMPVSNEEVLITNNNLKVYPNPVTHLTYINFSSSYSGNHSLEVYNSLGQLVKQETIFATQGENEIRLSTLDLTAGHYVVKMVSETGRWQKGRLVVLG